MFPDSPSARSLFNRNALRYQWRSNGPVITGAIILVCVAVWVVEALLMLVWPTGGAIMVYYGRFDPLLAVAEPWRFITSMFLHAPKSLMHIAFNMLTLWCVGPILEKLMGHWPFLALYLISGFGGSLGLMAWAALEPSGQGWLTGAYGASGALFGLFAAMLIVYRRIGEDIRSMLIWMGINFLMPFLTPGIAWQAHVGGFIIGGLFTLLLVSGPKFMLRAGLGVRTAVYGALLLGLIILGVMACDMASPVPVWTTLQSGGIAS